jgi:hypothetical protein
VRLLPAALAILLLGGLAALAVHQRVARLEAGYRLRRLLDEQGLLANEVRWRRADLARLEAAPALLPRAARLGLLPTERRGRTQPALPPRAPEPNL